MMRAALALAIVSMIALSTLPAQAAPAAETTPATRLAELLERGGVTPADMPVLEAMDLRAAILDLYVLGGAVPTQAATDELDARLAMVPEAIQAPTSDILVAMNAAARLRMQAFADVSVEDARFAYERTLTDTPLDVEDRDRLAAIHTKIDRELMGAAGILVLQTIESAVVELKEAKLSTGGGVGFVDPLGVVEIADETDHVHDGDRTLLIDLGGNDEWQNNAGSVMPDFVIQAFPGCITTGGLDCTPLAAKRNAPSTQSLFGRPCSADVANAAFVGLDYAEDLDAQVDEQIARPNPFGFAFWLADTAPENAAETATTANPDTRCLPQGPDDVQDWSEAFVEKGTLKDADEHVVAVGIDLDGDDRFAPLKVFNDINNGRNPPNCDTRDMGEEGKIWERNLTAGGAFAGIGVLWDESGTDFYGGRSLTQGTGHVGAIGVLVDRGTGDDEYESVRLAQGAAIFAAAGLLYDIGGNDLYRMANDVPFFNEFEHFIGCDVSTRDGQGRANFNAVAALIDDAGDDVYFVQDHDDDIPGASRDDPTTTQGSTGTRLNIGPHPINEAAALGLGLLWDRSGSDNYTRDGRADGVTDTTGMFIDE